MPDHRLRYIRGHRAPRNDHQPDHVTAAGGKLTATIDTADKTSQMAYNAQDKKVKSFIEFIALRYLTLTFLTLNFSH